MTISENVSIKDRTDNLAKAIKNVKHSIRLNRKRWKYSEGRCKHPYKLGQVVYIKTHYFSNKANKFSKKLALRYDGPYKILYFVTPITVLVQRVKGCPLVIRVL